MMKGIYTDKDLCPVCNKRHLTYDKMERATDGLWVCGKDCKAKHEEILSRGVMKQETIETLKRDLNKDKEKEESYEKNKDFIYRIEFLPVLTKRDSQGRLEEVTNYSNGLLFRCENGE